MAHSSAPASLVSESKVPLMVIGERASLSH
jgi:hypothetical protein